MKTRKMKQTERNIGYEVQTPKDVCDDKNCPFHGNIRVHGTTFVGTIVSDRMHKTVTVQWDRTNFVKKYERYETKRSKIMAHVPDCIKVKKGDIVKIAESRPISKAVNFVVIEKIE